MLELGVIADDLTGGMMVASLLEAEGVSCPLVTNVAALEALGDDPEAVVIGRKIRLLPPDEAVADTRRCGEALLAKGANRLYYKYSALFMSTDAGNIGPVAESLMSLTGVNHVLFCPTWRGVTVYLGRMFVNDKMLHESGASRDPVTPMTNSNLVEVLQAQSRARVGLMPLRVLRDGAAAARQYLAERAPDTPFFIADAIDAGDVARLAELVADSSLSTGADYLPIYLARHWRQDRGRAEPTPLLPPAPGHQVVLSGSCSPKTNRQLEHFEARHPVCRVDLLEAADDTNTVDKIVDWAAQRIAEGPVGIATTTDHAGVVRAQNMLGRQGAVEVAEDVLGRVTRRLHELGVRQFVVAGGETSGKVIDTLGIDKLQVAAFDYLGGGYCHAAGADPIALVTKSGGQGDEDFFVAALERLRAADAAPTNRSQA